MTSDGTNIVILINTVVVLHPRLTEKHCSLSYKRDWSLEFFLPT